jgi:hypothetical protein
MSERIITLEPGQRLTILAAPRPFPPRMPPPSPPPTGEAKPMPAPFPVPVGPRAPIPFPQRPGEEIRLPPWVPPGLVVALPVGRPTTPAPAAGTTQTQLLGSLGILDRVLARIASIRSRWMGQIEFPPVYQYGYQYDYQVLPEEFGIESR